MKHGVKYSNLNRTTAHRRALLRNLTAQLIQHERITTTLAKAKQVQRPVEKGTGNLTKLFSELSVRYAERPGGYTRLLKAGLRMHDKAPMAVLELVDNGLPALRPALTKETIGARHVCVAHTQRSLQRV